MAIALNDTKAATEALISKFEVSKLLKQGTSSKHINPAIKRLTIERLQTKMADELLYSAQSTANRAS